MSGRRTYDELAERRAARRMLDAKLSGRHHPPLDRTKVIAWTVLVVLCLAFWTACLHIMGLVV